MTSRRSVEMNALEALMMQRAKAAPAGKEWTPAPQVGGKVYCMPIRWTPTDTSARLLIVGAPLTRR